MLYICTFKALNWCLSLNHEKDNNCFINFKYVSIMKKFFTLIAVAAMAFAAQANVLTVCDNGGYDGYSNHVPVYGFWADSEGTTAQSIYPAAMLTDMAGGEITEVKFYTLAQYYVENDMDPYISATNFINFENAKIQLALTVVEEDGFSTTTIVGATPVATTVPEMGDMYMTFELDEPFAYDGGNLLVETMVIEGGSFGTTYFYGVVSGVPEYCSIYTYESSYSGTQKFFETFLPMVTFTYEPGQVTPPVDPTEKTGAPTFNGYTEDGIYAYFVEINETEPSTIYYRVIYPDGTVTEWEEYTEMLSFTGEGKYRVKAYAVAPGKLPSDEIAYEFVLSKMTGVLEVVGDKQVAGVRYFNLAGQEMTEANGLTIVVTTYTDGTTSAVKVMK